jgi:hypothetical protein
MTFARSPGTLAAGADADRGDVEAVAAGDAGECVVVGDDGLGGDILQAFAVQGVDGVHFGDEFLCACGEECFFVGVPGALGLEAGLDLLGEGGDEVASRGRGRARGAGRRRPLRDRGQSAWS